MWILRYCVPQSLDVVLFYGFYLSVFILPFYLHQVLSSWWRSVSVSVLVPSFGGPTPISMVSNPVSYINIIFLPWLGFVSCQHNCAKDIIRCTKRSLSSWRDAPMNIVSVLNIISISIHIFFILWLLVERRNEWVKGGLGHTQSRSAGTRSCCAMQSYLCRRSVCRLKHVIVTSIFIRASAADRSVAKS